MTQETYKVRVMKIIFRNDDNGYSVMKVRDIKNDNPFFVVGYFFDVDESSKIEVQGCFEESKYGKQLKCESWHPVIPTTIQGIQHYLSGGFIKGIGPVYAEKIVKTFGEDTIEVIENTPERLYEVKGIGKKRASKILEEWDKQRGARDIMTFLASHNISLEFSNRIYKKYKNNAVKLLTENPYRLTDDFIGVGFAKADKIAISMGITGKERYIAGIKHTMREMTKSGHVYAEPEQLIKLATDLLGVHPETLKQTVNYMVAQKQLIYDMGGIYLPWYHQIEKDAAELLCELLKAPVKKLKNKVQDSFFEPEQLEAIQMAAEKNVMVLTGGPGTGKSTVLSGILKMYQQNKKEVLLAAPTGRAAKRMEETTKMDASTIHKLLEWNMGYFSRDKENSLEGDAIIIDESSMIDIELFYSLLSAIPPGMRIIFVGDVDQLPSVGPGNVLRDMIESGVIPVTRLTHVHRQKRGSKIVTFAHDVNHGRWSDLDPADDFQFFEIEEPAEIADRVIEIAKEKNAQILSPMHDGVIGVRELNARMQKAVNPVGNSLEYCGITFRENDKIMQIKNNYTKNVFNGDIGKIVKITEDEIIAEFDGKKVPYDRDELRELTHAWACTIHKFQGSEAPCVVMPVSYSHYIMLQRNLLYTAVTRAKEEILLVGTKKAIRRAVENTVIRKRNTKLKERIQKANA